MRLIDKKDILVQKSTERKREIDEGVKLAKSIDTLRETHAKEQQGLKRFRDESLKVIKNEIEIHNKKRDELFKEIQILEEQKILAQAPIDLIKEWTKVKIDQEQIKSTTHDLVERESKVIENETTIQVKENLFAKREETIKENENLTNRFLTEANNKYLLAEKHENESNERAKQTQSILNEKDNELRAKETNLSVKERDLHLKEEQIEKEKQLIESEKLHIVSQQQTLRIAWENIRKLQK